MIYHRSNRPDMFLIVCGNFWPGAPEKNDYYDHFVRTGEATCGGKRPNTQPECNCQPRRRS